MDLQKTKEELYGKYYLKEHLINMYKEHNLPTDGSKEKLLEWLCSFIENKPIRKIRHCYLNMYLLYCSQKKL